MTKDLTQQGISDITVSNNGVTLDNSNGKLGKCYYFDGNAHYLQFSESVGDLYSGDFSYAVWLKPTDDTRSIICSEYAAIGESGIAFELTVSRQLRLYWHGSPDIYATGCVLPKNVWTHCAITRSGNVAKFYMNGELKYTYTGTLSNRISTARIRLGDDYRGGTSVSYMGYMNDFRIYDHALSAKEVKELSKGLVVHYPLDNNGQGDDSTYTDTTVYDTSGYGNNMTKTGTITYTANSIKYSLSSHFINGSYLMATQNCGEYLPKDSLTVNLWIKPTTWGNPISCTESGGWNFELTTGGLQFVCYIYSVGYKAAKSTIEPSDLIDGEWHMLTGVLDRISQQIKFYIDGELAGTNNTGSTNSIGYANNRLIISGEAQSTTPTSSTFVGEESDVRIYATALSEDDIKELYQSAAHIDNHGNVYGYEFKEVE